MYYVKVQNHRKDTLLQPKLGPRCTLGYIVLQLYCQAIETTFIPSLTPDNHSPGRNIWVVTVIVTVTVTVTHQVGIFGL